MQKCHFIRDLTRVQLQFRTVQVPWHHYRQASQDDIRELLAARQPHRGSAVQHLNLILIDLHQLLRFLIDPQAVIQSHWALHELITYLEGLSVHPQGEKERLTFFF